MANDNNFNLTINTLHFEQIKTIWTKYLWPDRKSDIQPISSMVYLGGTDMSIHDRFSAIHWGAWVDGHLVGVNSGHRTTEALYRSRGLWVSPEYRRRGIATALLLSTLEQANRENCLMCWTCPRKDSWKCYEAIGFERRTNWTYAMEYGPNCYAILDLDYLKK